MKPIIDLLYPRRCPMCQDIVPVNSIYENICESCHKILPYIGKNRCLKCGKQVGSEEIEYCEDCIRIPKSFRKGFPVFNYISPFDKGLAALKYHNKKEYASFYAKEIINAHGDTLKSLGIDLVVPVPVHKKKLKIRGYNQAELIAKPISQYLKVPMETNLLVRVSYTPPQKELNDIERIKNLKKAFLCSQNELKLNSILIVDDIYTTGATIEACTRILMNTSVDNVYYTSVCAGRGY